MDYVLDMVRYGRTEKILDRGRFAADLAAKLGGTVIPPENPEERENPDYAWVCFAVGDLRIYVGKAGYNAGRVRRASLSCGPSRTVSRRLAGQTRTTYPSMTCDTSRDLDSIAKEVSRKLIEPAAEPLARDLKMFRDMDSDRSVIAAKRAELLKRFPFAETPRGDEKRIIRIKEPDERGNSVDIYASGDGFSLSGRLNPSGKLYIDRLSLDVDAATLLSFLYGKG